MSVATVAAHIARRICDVENVGYSQPDRRTWYTNADWEGHVKSPQNADCSSLVCGAINYGLHDTYNIPWGHKALLEINDFWTGNMRDGMEARGFNEVPWNDSDSRPNGGFQTGDIILSAANEGGLGHVAIITDAAADLVSEAWIAEDGGIDGYLGDQTGGETRTVAYSSHPHTKKGAWTSCHRFSETKFLAQWPNFTKTAAKPTLTLPKPSGEPAYAHGIDVSSHQAGINIPALWADFVIVKATEDDDYMNPHMNTQATATLNAGKRLGFYHFARPGNATTQAHYFVNTIRPYISRATLWLDCKRPRPRTRLGQHLARHRRLPDWNHTGHLHERFHSQRLQLDQRRSQVPPLVRRRPKLLQLGHVLHGPSNPIPAVLGPTIDPSVHRGRTPTRLRRQVRPQPAARPHHLGSHGGEGPHQQREHNQDRR